MKYLKQITVILLLLGILTGCTAEETPKTGIRFYYPPIYDTQTVVEEVISYELRQLSTETAEIEYILNQYFLGPISQELVNIIPYGTVVKLFSKTDTAAGVTVSDEFAQLEGIELTISCVCLAKTVMDLTGVSFVQISAENLLLNNHQRISIDKDSLLLFDTVNDNARNRK